MIPDYRTHRVLKILAAQYKLLCVRASRYAVGKQARVISKFNGQPYGSSRKPLTGELLRITGVCLTEDGDVTLITDDSRVGAGFALEDVEILKEEEK